MSESPMQNVDEMDFDYSPEQPLSAEQRIELLELEVGDLHHQLGALVEQFGWLCPISGNCTQTKALKSKCFDMRVLIIDDAADICWAHERLLRWMGHEAIGLQDPGQGLAQA